MERPEEKCSKNNDWVRVAVVPHGSAAACAYDWSCEVTGFVVHEYFRMFSLHRISFIIITYCIGHRFMKTTVKYYAVYMLKAPTVCRIALFFDHPKAILVQSKITQTLIVLLKAKLSLKL